MTPKLKELLKEVECADLDEAITLFEINAQEWLERGEKEYARESMIVAALIREHSAVVKALADCYMMACRRARGLATPNTADWNHVKRFCESTGLKSQLLRASLPTEMTEGLPATEGKE